MIQFEFHGQVVGGVLGDAVTVQVRGADYLAAGIIVLAVTAAAALAPAHLLRRLPAAQLLAEE